MHGSLQCRVNKNTCMQIVDSWQLIIDIGVFWPPLEWKFTSLPGVEVSRSFENNAHCVANLAARISKPTCWWKLVQWPILLLLKAFPAALFYLLSTEWCLPSSLLRSDHPAPLPDSLEAIDPQIQSDCRREVRENAGKEKGFFFSRHLFNARWKLLLVFEWCWYLW